MRDDQGRFVPGTTGNPNGRPRKSTKAPVRDGLARALAQLQANATVETIEQSIADLWKPILARAADGDLDAAKLVFAYLQGKPPQTINHRIGEDEESLLEDLRSLISGQTTLKVEDGAA